jgi:hypothetical protein
LRSAVAVGIDQAVDGKAQRQLLTFTGVAADQRAVSFIQYLHGTGHHLKHQILDLAFQSRRYGRHRCRRLRFGTHREHIAERMVGGHPPEHIWVVDKGAEEIDGVDRGLAGRDAHHGSIVRRMQANDHIIPVHRLQLAQRARQHAGADLGATTTATHRDRGNGLLRLILVARQA